MKKSVACLLAICCTVACLVCLTACGGSSVPTYYEKTITFTGNALPILWDKKCNTDVGPDNSWDESKHDFADTKDYSLKELLTKYWDRIDLEYESPEVGTPWASMKGKTVDEFIAEIDKGLNGFYDRWLDMEMSKFLKLEFGSKSDRTLKITMNGGDGEKVYETKFVENVSQLEEERSKFDPKAFYLNETLTPDNEGKFCIAFVDTNNDGLYDGYFQIRLTAYIVNDDKPTCEVHTCMMSGINEYDGNYYSNTFGFEMITQQLAFWEYSTENGSSTIMSLPLYPEIVIE